jgi:urease accessory protein
VAGLAGPAGGRLFSYSEGLEAAVDEGLVTDEASAGRLAGRPAAPDAGARRPAVLAQAMPPGRPATLARVRTLNDWVLHTRETSELRLQTEQMGRSLADWLRPAPRRRRRLAAIAGHAAAPPTPVAFALAASRTGAPVRDIALAFAFGWAENMVQAALKAVPLGQSAGQRILARLAQRNSRRGRCRAGAPRRRRSARPSRPDAGHPVGPARNPVFAAVPLMTGLPRRPLDPKAP